MKETETTMSDEHFEALLNGEPITDTVETSRGEATIVFLDDTLQIQFIRRKAELLGGTSPDSLSPQDALELERTAILDVAVVEGPKGWQKGNSAAYPDRVCKEILYRGCLRLFNEVHGLQPSRPDDTTHSELPPAEPSQSETCAVSPNNPEDPKPKVRGSWARVPKKKD